MDNSLPLEKIDYSVDLNNKLLFTSSFDGLHVTPAMGEQHVNFPFRIAYKDILKLPPEILEQGMINIKFKGMLYTNRDLRLNPVPFEINQEFPIPRIPVVTLSNKKSKPFKRNLKLVFEVDNKNFFPLDIEKINYYMEVNNEKYDLSKSNKTKNIKPKSSGELVLRVKKADKKKNIYSKIKKSGTYQLLGSIEYKTPYGVMQAPLQIKVEK